MDVFSNGVVEMDTLFPLCQKHDTETLLKTWLSEADLQAKQAGLLLPATL